MQFISYTDSFLAIVTGHTLTSSHNLQSLALLMTNESNNLLYASGHTNGSNHFFPNYIKYRFFFPQQIECPLNAITVNRKVIEDQGLMFGYKNIELWGILSLHTTFFFVTEGFFFQIMKHFNSSKQLHFKLSSTKMPAISFRHQSGKCLSICHNRKQKRTMMNNGYKTST